MKCTLYYRSRVFFHSVKLEISQVIIQLSGHTQNISFYMFLFTCKFSYINWCVLQLLLAIGAYVSARGA